MPTVGVTFARVKVSNPRRSDLGLVELEFLVDTGAIYSVVPTSVLDALGVARLERHEFTLADGTHQAYDIAEACFELETRGRISQVVFAPEGVTPLLGVFTLESLGLMVNPVTRELLPMRLFLATAARPGAGSALATSPLDGSATTRPRLAEATSTGARAMAVPPSPGARSS